jgi:hypothetical protein
MTFRPNSLNSRKRAKRFKKDKEMIPIEKRGFEGPPMKSKDTTGVKYKPAKEAMDQKALSTSISS